jgi:hypothetical protein
VSEIIVDTGPLVAMLVRTVLTIDSDFGVYRKHGRRVIPLIAPER